MNDLQINLLSRRKHYRDRRNTVRKIFFFLFLIWSIYSVYFVSQIPNKKILTIELSKNYLVKDVYITQNISKHIVGKNFFFLSPRILAQDLLLSCGLFKDIVMRKYLLPELKLVISVKEKQLWGRLVASNTDNALLYVTNEGNLVNGDYINLSFLPRNLVLIFCTNSKFASEATLIRLKNTLDFFKTNLKITIDKFLITERNTLEIYTDNSIKIDAGYIDSNLLDKITKLSDILNQIKKKSYLIQYIDLSLENGAVVKKLNEKETDKKHLKLFMILR